MIEQAICLQRLRLKTPPSHKEKDSIYETTLSDTGSYKEVKLDASTLNSPPQPGKGHILHPWQCLPCQIPHSPGQSDGQTSGVCLGGGREDAEFELIGILHKLSTITYQTFNLFKIVSPVWTNGSLSLNDIKHPIC